MKSSAMHGESGYKRIANDAYWTPHWCTAALLDRVTFEPMVWEPACGKGHISTVLTAHSISHFDSDLLNHGHGLSGLDFLNEFIMQPGCSSIITNPPYGLAEAFIRKALELTKSYQGRVAMLLRNEYDCAAKRRDLFEHPAFFKKIILTKRPRWFADGGASPRHNFAWYVWCWKNPLTVATMGWAP